MMHKPILLLIALACQPRGPQASPADTGATSDDPPLTTGPSSPEPTKTGPVDVSFCQAGPGTPGPWEDHPITQAGATVTREPYTNDAGLDDVVLATLGQTNPVAVDLAVAGAVVTSIDYVPAMNDGTATFWLEDGIEAISTYRVDTGTTDPVDLLPGDVVNFVALAVEDYFGLLEITAVQDFEVVDHVDVHVIDGTAGGELDYNTQGMRTVETWGGLPTEPEPCGGQSVCFDFVYPGGTGIYRTESTLVQPGDCIHFIGPLGQFQGVPQLDAKNFDWARFY